MVSSENLVANVGGVDIEAHITQVVHDAGTLLQVIEGIDAILCLVGTCLRLAAHPVELGAQQVAGTLDGGILRLDALGTLLQVVVVVALVAVDGLLIHLQNLVADIVEEVAVVGDHEQRDIAAFEIVLEPLNHVDVQVVGGLIEDEHLRLADEQLGQSHALDLTTRQLGDGLVIIINFEHGQDLLESILIVPRSGIVHGLDGGCHRIGIAAAQCMLIVAHSPTLAVIAPQTGVHHTARALEGGHLRQVAHTQVVAIDDGAAVGGVLAGQDVEQGTLSGAILGDEPNFLALGHAEGDATDDDIGTKRLGQVLDLQITSHILKKT